ncbi:ABC transporter ATP-binding protein [Halomonas sp. QX-2]|jgi:lipopolysaccharide transport system ATP-binding protein|uniref:ABC transporter ATP-binding protein n=1 Tax=Vreelandella sedimenti TaxID=2729618 RepID=A0A7Z0N9V6_9GAMM|nr:ABC transporter ATP-binding protein [Halomonas sedimenti]NYT74325.1 ABC transporter ATP-binding protein [Halomonas sedimenti]
MSSEIAIRVEGLCKEYRVYEKPSDRLKQTFAPLIAKLRRRETKLYYREFRALRDISFTVRRGQTVGLIGRNGSGKSTLLQLICQTLTPTSGIVEVNGRVAALLELGAGFNPEFTGKENVYLYASVMGLSQTDIDSRYDNIVAFADIGEFIGQPVKTYSSGMLLRLAFAVIAHVDADILIVDEALAVGDAFFVQKCMRFLRRFMETGTVLFVSHDSSVVTNLCNHAIWLEKGNVIEQGDPKQVAEHYLESQYAENTPFETPVPSEQQAEESQPEEDGGESIRQTDSQGEASDYTAAEDFYDMRREWINNSKWRNDIELFAFDPDAPSFGEKGAEVTSVVLLSEEDKMLHWVVGGEAVHLQINCKAHHSLKSPIVGFVIKDRLGQTLFGDNTFLGTEPISMSADDNFCAHFEFRMPILPAGQYSVCVALADGTQQEHRQHHWIHDALIVTSHASSVAHGLVGIPMRRVALESLNIPAS